MAWVILRELSDRFLNMCKIWDFTQKRVSCFPRNHCRKYTIVIWLQRRSKIARALTLLRSAEGPSAPQYQPQSGNFGVDLWALADNYDMIEHFKISLHDWTPQIELTCWLLRTIQKKIFWLAPVAFSRAKPCLLWKHTWQGRPQEWKIQNNISLTSP